MEQEEVSTFIEVELRKYNDIDFVMIHNYKRKQLALEICDRFLVELPKDLTKTWKYWLRGGESIDLPYTREDPFIYDDVYISFPFRCILYYHDFPHSSECLNGNAGKEKGYRCICKEPGSRTIKLVMVFAYQCGLTNAFNTKSSIDFMDYSEDKIRENLTKSVTDCLDSLDNEFECHVEYY